MASVTAAILGIAGCYGQTDLPTNVGQHGATLQARGTADNGPADVFFQYWKSSTPQAKLQTHAKAVPGGSSGAFNATVNSLDDATAYSYRLCGKDRSASGDPVCAQTRSFRTGEASVQVTGATFSPRYEDEVSSIDINASTAPLAGRVYGIWTYGGPGSPVIHVPYDVGSKTTDNVTCLNVEGNVAVIGFHDDSSPYPFERQNRAIVVDNGPAGSGKDEIVLAPTAEIYDPSDCSIPAQFDGHLLRGGDASVSGSTSNPTLR